jgi:hypothetical protein
MLHHETLYLMSLRLDVDIIMMLVRDNSGALNNSKLHLPVPGKTSNPARWSTRQNSAGHWHKYRGALKPISQGFEISRLQTSRGTLYI